MENTNMKTNSDNKNSSQTSGQQDYNHSSQQNNELGMDEFASALPSWNLEPPSIVVRRVKRTI